MNESAYNILYINIALDYRAVGGGRVMRWCWVNFQYNLDYSRAKAYCTCSRCGWGLFGHFTVVYPFSPLSPSLWEPARYRLKYCLKRPLNPTQPTNQIQGRRRLVKSDPAKYPRVPKAREERDRDISLSGARTRVYVSVCKGLGDCVGWVSSSEIFFQI